jgi:hypothetical protein
VEVRIQHPSREAKLAEASSEAKVVTDVVRDVSPGKESRLSDVDDIV